MKTNKNAPNMKVLLLAHLLLTISCVTFRPDFYDSETRTYNNYKNNYSVKILDGFEFTSKDSIKDPISKTFVYKLPLKAKVVYNKHYPIFISFYEYPQASTKLYQSFIQNKDNVKLREDMKDGLLKIFKNINMEIVDIKIEDINGFINFDYVMSSKLVEINQNLSITAFMVEQQHPKSIFFIANILCFPSHETIAKEKYVEFLNGIQFHSFSEEERRK